MDFDPGGPLGILRAAICLSGDLEENQPVRCLLPGAKRTSIGYAGMSLFDPKPSQKALPETGGLD
jgi:hypothetical protein